MTEYHIPVLELVLTMANAVDLVSPAVGGHHKRVTYLSSQLARELGLSSPDTFDLVVAAALHDIGAFSIKERLETLEFEIASPHAHAEMGYLFLHRFQPFLRLADIVRFHHVRWDGGHGATFNGYEVPASSHILHLADRIDVLSLDEEGKIPDPTKILDRIETERGRTFKPEIVDAFHAFAAKEYIWLDLRSSNLDRILSDTLSEQILVLDDRSMLSFAQLLAHLVDFRSRYTSTHTAGVAETARFIAEHVGMDPSHCRRVRLAGYLHDLGKLAVGREILDKESGLEEQEYGLLKAHPYFTRRILETIKDFSDIAIWASAHHERPDGTGYPFHERHQPIEAQIIAVADVFTAITEDRPYRSAMNLDDAAKTLRQMSANCLLDSTLVELALTHQHELDETRRLAQAEASEQYAAIMAQAV
ncbi:MAG: phosphohydrolase [Acidobacteria bacterium]|nr:MAG: phosphohydrolase [Acidobacteriota bacterium]